MEMKTVEADKLLELMDELGISTVLVIVRDPDDNGIQFRAIGDPLWLNGAAEIARIDLKSGYIRRRGPINDKEE